MKLLFFKPHPLVSDYIKEWEEENDIKVDIINELISYDNIDKTKEYDGIVLTVGNALEDDMYQTLADNGIKQLSITSVGYEQVDLDKATEAGLVVTNCPDYSPESIAEFTLMMMLKALRHDTRIKEQLDKRDFRHNQPVLGKTLMDKTVGIYGLGRIGLHVAKLAKAFGAKVISHSPRKKPEAEGIVEMVDSYDAMLAEADIICIHSALTDENYHFFDKEVFDKMKDGAIIVNCARGAIIDTKAMIVALDEGKLGFAALDVYEHEGPFIARNNPDAHDPLFEEILNHPKIDFYQHISYFTDTALRNQTRKSLDNAVEVIKTGDSEKRVN